MGHFHTIYSASITHSSFKIFSAFKLSDNVSRNLNWSSGLYIIPTIVGFVFAIRSSIKIFSILFEHLGRNDQDYLQFSLLTKITEVG